MNKEQIRVKEKAYLDFIDADIKETNKKVDEHRQQAEFHKKQHEYWSNQAQSLSGLRFRVASDLDRGTK